MRNLCLLLTALSVGSAPALAQSGPAASARTDSGASQKPATKRVCKRVADVNSLVAKKVCRVVVVDGSGAQRSEQPAQEQNSGMKSAGE